MAQTPQDALIDRAKAMTSELEKIWDSRLEVILKLCATTPSLFPARQGKKAIQALTDIDDVYLEAFICRYYAEREGILVLKPVATKPDPAVDEVLKAFGAVRTKDLEAVAKNHRLSMQAENIVGKLLERYVATLLEKKGWIWCCGETMRSIDFVKVLADETVEMLQIKNRDNSENSSSSAVRAGTKIKKWYRINSRTGKTRWALLQENLNEGGVMELTEEGFYEFVIAESMRSPEVEKLAADETENEDA